MCVRCLKEGFQSGDSSIPHHNTFKTKKKNFKSTPLPHIRPKWSPVENNEWWNQHVTIETLLIDGYQFRYCFAIPPNHLFNLVVLPEWGFSFLSYSSLVHYLFSNHIAVWFLDQRSQGLSEIIYPHSHYLCVNNMNSYLSDLIYFTQEVVIQKYSINLSIPLNLLLFDYCGGSIIQSPLWPSLCSLFRQVILINPITSPTYQLIPNLPGLLPKTTASWFFYFFSQSNISLFLTFYQSTLFFFYRPIFQLSSLCDAIQPHLSRLFPAYSQIIHDTKQQFFQSLTSYLFGISIPSSLFHSLDHHFPSPIRCLQIKPSWIDSRSDSISCKYPFLASRSRLSLPSLSWLRQFQVHHQRTHPHSSSSSNTSIKEKNSLPTLLDSSLHVILSDDGEDDEKDEEELKTKERLLFILWGGFLCRGVY